MGRLRGADHQWGYHSSTGGSDRAVRSWAYAHFGHHPQLHSHLYHCAGQRRARHAGQPHRRFVATPVRAGRVAPIAATDHYAGCLRNGAHADRSDAHPHRIRQSSAGARGSIADWRATQRLGGRWLSTVLGLRATGALRLWSSLIAIAAGCIVAAFFGLYDIQRVIQAPWFGFPESALPGLELGLSARFWAILPMFLVVTLVDTIRAVGDSIVIQRVSRRGPRVTDFRLVQGAVNANGLGTLLAGIAGTPPPITYSAASVTLTQLTGVASRRVGYAIAAMLVGLALLPKLAALMLTIPSPVIGAYLLIILGPIFLEGMKTVVQDNPDYRKALVVAVAFPIGVGLQNQMFLADLLGGAWSTLLSNGLTVGALVAILMTSFLELTSPRRRRLKVDLGIASLPKLDAFLHEFASKIGWDGESRERLRAVGEETLLSLFRQDEDYESDQARGLILYARTEGEAVELEFLAFSEQENIEDRMAHTGEWLDTSDEDEISSHLLRHYASSVHHRKYHDIDIVKIHVEGSR